MQVKETEVQEWNSTPAEVAVLVDGLLDEVVS